MKAQEEEQKSKKMGKEEPQVKILIMDSGKSRAKDDKTAARGPVEEMLIGASEKRRFIRKIKKYNSLLCRFIEDLQKKKSRPGNRSDHQNQK